MSEARNAKLKDQYKRDQITRKLVITTLMANPDGRRYIWCELAEANVFAQTFTSAPGGPLITAFKEGQRSHGLKLLVDVTKWCPEGYLQMTRENAAVAFEEETDERSTDPD